MVRLLFPVKLVRAETRIYIRTKKKKKPIIPRVGIPMVNKINFITFVSSSAYRAVNNEWSTIEYGRV